MKEVVIFSYSVEDFLKHPSTSQISMMMTLPFLYAVQDIVNKICGDRMEHPLVDIAYYKPELTFTVSVNARDIFHITFNKQVAPAIIEYFSHHEFRT